MSIRVIRPTGAALFTLSMASFDSFSRLACMSILWLALPSMICSGRGSAYAWLRLGLCHHVSSGNPGIRFFNEFCISINNTASIAELQFVHEMAFVVFYCLVVGRH